MPKTANFSWILFVLVCPLSMIIMMYIMNHNQGKSDKSFVCPECGLFYKDSKWAGKCAAWCKEHKTCNVEIIKHAVEKPQ